MKNDAYLKSDTSIAGDERYTPYYAVTPILEFLPPPRSQIIRFGVRLMKIGQRLYNVCARQGTQ